jgi:hypothetical protein
MGALWTRLKVSWLGSLAAWVGEAMASWLGSFAAWAAVAAIVWGFRYAGQQIQQSRESLQATVILDSETHFHDLFAKTDAASFRKCFGVGAQPLPQPCPDLDARETFSAIVSYLQMLTDLQRRGAIDAPFVQIKVHQFCTYAGGGAGPPRRSRSTETTNS